MGANFDGTFVISWDQTTIDGYRSQARDALTVGGIWAWHGEMLRIDGPNTILRLKNPTDIRRKRIARVIERLMGTEEAPGGLQQQIDRLPSQSMSVTDGKEIYHISFVDALRSETPLWVFENNIPPRHIPLRILKHAINPVSQRVADPGMICFADGSRIHTPRGKVPVELLRPGDHVLTKDNGPQPICWIGKRKLSRAWFSMMRKDRPICISTGAIGLWRPDGDLVVSPNHRLLLTGAAARDLFNSEEVFVRARDLVNGTTVRVDNSMTPVTYIHLMFDAHQVIWANGVESESFHPAQMSLATLRAQDKSRLMQVYPDLEHDQMAYGEMARRVLTSSEAALLQHAA